MQRVLFAMRHAEAEPWGASDRSRRLTPQGFLTARAAGEVVRPAGVQRILCSPATRAASTAEALGVGVAPEPYEVLYNAHPDAILEVLAGLDDEVTAAVIVAHAPGIPALIHALADPATSDPGARAAIAHHFPAGTVARLEFEGPWSELSCARLTQTRLGA